MFTEAVAQYIYAQRNRYYEHGKQLTFGESWTRYFAAADLERVRILEFVIGRTAAVQEPGSLIRMTR